MYIMSDTEKKIGDIATALANITDINNTTDMDALINLSAHQVRLRELYQSMKQLNKLSLEYSQQLPNSKEPPLKWVSSNLDHVKIDENGMLVTHTMGGNVSSLTTAGNILATGRHYWEVEIVNDYAFIGVCSPDVSFEDLIEPVEGAKRTEANSMHFAWFMNTKNGGIRGPGMYEWENIQDGFNRGDRVGILLDLDNGELQFSKISTNDEKIELMQYTNTFSKGWIKGSVVLAVQMNSKDSSVRLHPNTWLSPSHTGQL